MPSKIRPREFSESLADASNNGSDKVKEPTKNIKLFERVKTRIIESIPEFLIYLRGRSNFTESDTESSGSQESRLPEIALRHLEPVYHTHVWC